MTPQGARRTWEAREEKEASGGFGLPWRGAL